MKKHLLTLFSLLLLSTTVTLAQTGGIVDITGAGTSQGMNINEKVFGRGLTMPVGNKLVAGATGEASLHLRSDALVMEVTKTEMVGDDFVPRTTELWSIPFPNPAKELAFTPQGELIVRITEAHPNRRTQDRRERQKGQPIHSLEKIIVPLPGCFYSTSIRWSRNNCACREHFLPRIIN
jgi:hypothetical protein